MLWDFLVAMRDDLAGVGVRSPVDWDARLFCYKEPEETPDLIDFLLSTCAVEDEAVTVVRPAEDR